MELLEVKNTISKKKKNSLDGLNSRWDTAEEKINELEYIALESIEK